MIEALVIKWFKMPRCYLHCDMETSHLNHLHGANVTQVDHPGSFGLPIMVEPQK